MDEGQKQDIILVQDHLIKSLTFEDINNLGQDALSELFKEFVLKKIPFLGETISTVDNIKTSHQIRSILKGLVCINQNLFKLQNESKEKLDKTFIDVNNPEFMLITSNTLEKISQQYKDEKIKYLANFLSNIMTTNFSKMHHKEGILEKVAQYSVEHILILKFFYDKNNDDNIKSKFGGVEEKTFELNDIKVKDIETEEIEVCLLDLESDGFIKELVGAIFDYSGGAYYITGYGKKCIEILKEI